METVSIHEEGKPLIVHQRDRAAASGYALDPWQPVITAVDALAIGAASHEEQLPHYDRFCTYNGHSCDD